MPIAQLAEELAAGREPRDVIRADHLVDLHLDMAQRSLALAQQAVARGGNNPAELRRFVQDSQCLIYTIEYYRHKIRAALAKRLFEKTGAPEHAAALREHMTASVAKYEQMFTYAQQFYTAGSSMWDAKPWQRCFDEKVKPDYERQMQWLAERGQ